MVSLLTPGFRLRTIFVIVVDESEINHQRKGNLSWETAHDWSKMRNWIVEYWRVLITSNKVCFWIRIVWGIFTLNNPPLVFLFFSSGCPSSSVTGTLTFFYLRNSNLMKQNWICYCNIPNNPSSSRCRSALGPKEKFTKTCSTLVSLIHNLNQTRD